MTSTNHNPPAGVETLGLGDAEGLDELEVEWGLPLRGAKVGNGYPEITVDCYTFSPGNRATISHRLSLLWNTGGEAHDTGESRFYFFAYETREESFRPQDIIAIAVLRDCEPDAVTFDLPVEVIFEPRGDDLKVPYFTLTQS